MKLYHLLHQNSMDQVQFSSILSQPFAGSLYAVSINGSVLSCMSPYFYPSSCSVDWTTTKSIPLEVEIDLYTHCFLQILYQEWFEKCE